MSLPQSYGATSAKICGLTPQHESARRSAPFPTPFVHDSFELLRYLSYLSLLFSLPLRVSLRGAFPFSMLIPLTPRFLGAIEPVSALRGQYHSSVFTRAFLLYLPQSKRYLPPPPIFSAKLNQKLIISRSRPDSVCFVSRLTARSFLSFSRVTMLCPPPSRLRHCSSRSLIRRSLQRCKRMSFELSSAFAQWTHDRIPPPPLPSYSLNVFPDLLLSGVCIHAPRRNVIAMPPTCILLIPPFRQSWPVLNLSSTDPRFFTFPIQIEEPL